jgi:hypothetical protein
MYLMFEALGRITDRELMLVNLDLLDILNVEDFPPHRLNFLLYNPTRETRSASIAIPAAQGGKVESRRNGNLVAETLNVPRARSFTPGCRFLR